jgi:hypothetical protein
MSFVKKGTTEYRDTTMCECQACQDAKAEFHLWPGSSLPESFHKVLSHVPQGSDSPLAERKVDCVLDRKHILEVDFPSK